MTNLEAAIHHLEQAEASKLPVDWMTHGTFALAHLRDVQRYIHPFPAPPIPVRDKIRAAVARYNEAQRMPAGGDAWRVELGAVGMLMEALGEWVG